MIKRQVMSLQVLTGFKPGDVVIVEMQTEFSAETFDGIHRYLATVAPDIRFIIFRPDMRVTRSREISLRSILADLRELICGRKTDAA